MWMYNIKQHKMELFDIDSVINHILYLDYFDINSKCVGLLSPVKPNPNPHIPWKRFPVWLVVSVNTVVTTWWKGAEGPSLLFPLLRMFPLWPVGGDPGKQLDNRSQMLFLSMRGMWELISRIHFSWFAWKMRWKDNWRQCSRWWFTVYWWHKRAWRDFGRFCEWKIMGNAALLVVDHF